MCVCFVCLHLGADIGACFSNALQAAEMPSAQMYAKLHARQQQQQPGSRAHVLGHMPPQATGLPTTLQPLQQQQQTRDLQQ